MKAMRYLQHGCSLFLAYIVDTRVEGRKSIKDAPIVQDFSNMFLENLSGVPHVR